jgi:AcrR family transcriptional regulator
VSQPATPPTLGRREANRAATIAAIKAAALHQVAQEGAPALSIRGVARAVGISPAGMYRYYDGRDALLTDLLADAYGDLADAVAGAAGLAAPTGGADSEQGDVATVTPAIADPLGGLLDAIMAYRRWAVENPARFLLLFGTPVPGYAAPADGPTVAANRRMGRTFFTLAALAWRAGVLADPSEAGARTPNPTEAGLLVQLQHLAPGFPDALIPRMLAGWALWHGLVTLELTGQLHWIRPDAEAFYMERMSAWLQAFASGRA